MSLDDGSWRAPREPTETRGEHAQLHRERHLSKPWIQTWVHLCVLAEVQIFPPDSHKKEEKGS